MNHLDATGPYIWLRYATQYNKDGQMHTIEMSVPVPLGASTERREELFREAEAGMNQLASRFGQRMSQTPQRVQDSQAGYNAASRSVPIQKSVSPQQSRNKPASGSAPQAASQPSEAQRREADPMSASAARNQEPVVPPTRPNVGASMPMALGPNLDSSGNLPLPEFIQYINENLNLTPRQAMEMLKVKSLSTGVNLREALERLRNLVAQRNTNSVAQLEESVESEIEPEHPGAHQEAPPSSASASISPATETQIQQSSQIVDDQTSQAGGSQQEDDQSQIIEMRVSAPVRFDEEEDPEEEEKLEDFHLPREFTSKQLEYARNRISELRESQGPSIVSQQRLQALANVISDNITQEQLQELIMGIWSVSVLKKLKKDQVEALISWAKQDDFIDEVEAVLTVLEEDRYARGNR
ncbi:MAG TPA: hypothetical protein VGL94_07020 [Ktedonobacteraceae bacterium]|jgi:hypothetical protein